MEDEAEQSIQVSANNYEEHGGDDDINADEEINEVLEDEEMDKSMSAVDDTEEIKEQQQHLEEGSIQAAQHSDQIENDDDDEQPQDSEDKPEEEEEEEDLDTNENADTNEDDGGKENANKKLLKMQLSTQTLQKLLKEGKMEKLPTGSFRISSDALRELKKDEPDNEENNLSATGSSNSNKKRKISEVLSEEETQTPPSSKKKNVSHKKKSSASRNIKKVPVKKDTNTDNTRQKTKTNLFNKKSEIKKVAKIHDYVSDFNSSEDEDDETINELRDSIAELAPRRNNRLAKPVNLLFDELHKAMFGNISDDEELEEDDEEMGDEEERIKELAMSDPDFGAADSSSNIHDIPDNFWMVGRIGDDNQTKMCIRSTGKNKTMEGEQYPVYNIDTGVGSVTTVTPLVVTAMKVSDASDKAPVDFDKHDPDLVEQLNQKTVKLRKYKEQVKVLRQRYLKVVRQMVSQPQLQTIADLVSASSRFLTQDQLMFFTMQLKSGCDSTQGARFSTREKILSLSLYQQHPDTYKWLHRIFSLPSTAVLERWLDTVARGNPKRVKQLMYHVYTRYSFRPREDMLPHAFLGY